ncbi:cyclic nucleotide-binding domain-containing protein [Jatrophihabitans sp. DSM 45814]
MTTNQQRPPAAELLALSADLPTVSIQAGEKVVEQGVAAPAIYVLVRGSLVMDRDGTPFATVDYPGAVFGEMSTVLARTATATVTAGAPSVLHVAADVDAFLGRPEVALAVLRLTANRLDAMTRYLADVRGQYAHLDNHLGMVGGVLEALLHYQAPAARPGSARDPLG